MKDKGSFCMNIDIFANNLIKKMKIEKKSTNTIKSYNRTYKSFMEFCKQHYKQLSFNNIKEDDIYAFISYKSETMNKQGDISTSTSNSLVSHLKKLFKHIERNSDELFDFDKIFEDIKIHQPERKPKGLDEEQYVKLINYLESMKLIETYTNYRNIVLAKLMLFGGLRASEAISISLDNIDIADEALYKINFKGKGNKKRLSYINKDYLEDELETLQNTFNIKTSLPIALTQNNKVMDRTQLSKMMNSIYKKANIKATGLHILRHTFAKKLLDKGISIVVVQSLLGHNSIQTTSIYTNPTENIIKNELLKDKYE